MHIRSGWLSLVVAGWLLVACGNPPAAPAILTVAPAEAPLPSGQSAAQNSASDALKTALQATMNQWSQAFQENNPTLLRQIIDPTSYRLRSELARELQFAHDRNDPGHNPDRTWLSTVQTAQRQTNGLAQATVNVDDQQRSFIFKQVEDRWLLSMPSRGDYGVIKTMRGSHFTIQYYDWDAPIVADVAAVLDRVRTAISAKLGQEPPADVTVQLLPANTLIPPTPQLHVGNIYANRDGTRFRDDARDLVVVSPNSFDFPWYEQNGGWQLEMSRQLEREMTFLISDCCFAALRQQNFWLMEGLAQYVAPVRSTPVFTEALRTAIRENKLLPLRGNGADQQFSLERPSFTDSNFGLIFSQSAMLTRYIIAEHGGMAGYRALVQAYAVNRNLDQSLESTFKMSYADFEQAWRAYMTAQLQ